MGSWCAYIFSTWDSIICFNLSKLAGATNLHKAMSMNIQSAPTSGSPVSPSNTGKIVLLYSLSSDEYSEKTYSAHFRMIWKFSNSFEYPSPFVSKFNSSCSPNILPEKLMLALSLWSCKVFTLNFSNHLWRTSNLTP